MGSSFRIKSGADGKYYLTARFTNRWRDYDFHAAPEKGGEIIASAAHKEYLKWLDKNPHHAPELWTWHTPGTERKNRASWWDYTGNFFYMQWELSKEEVKAIKQMVTTGVIDEIWWKRAEPGVKWGLSFGFYSLKYDWENAAVDKYRAFEVSILPLSKAANPWTEFDIAAVPVDGEANGEKCMKFDKERRKLIVSRIGEEAVKELEALDDEDAARLDASGVDTKSKKSARKPDKVAIATAKKSKDKTAESEAEEDSEGAVEGEVEDIEEGSSKAATEVAVVAALERLKALLEGKIGALEAEIKAVKAQNDALQKALGEAAEREEAEAKMAAAPPSVLATFLAGKSIASGKKNSATVRKGSEFSKKGPKFETPAQVARKTHGLSTLYEVMDDTGIVEKEDDDDELLEFGQFGVHLDMGFEKDLEDEDFEDELEGEGFEDEDDEFEGEDEE